jgi:copper homeostasis protein CutC
MLVYQKIRAQMDMCFGPLTPSGDTDKNVCKEMTVVVTFHRAFDVCQDIHVPLPAIIEAG